MNSMQKSINRIIQTAMDEDHVYDDVTTKILVDKKQTSQAYIISREEGIVCGSGIVKKIFQKFDRRVKVFAYHKDGDNIRKNEPIIFIKGPTRSILSCERIALNFLGRLSGIATLTSEFVKRAGSKIKILDTRKTTPGLRILEKMAVKTGGGTSHRLNLSDMVLIKDNHRLAKNKLSLKEAVNRLRQATNKKIEIEVDTLEQFKEVLSAKPDFILLDNMSAAQLQKAVMLKKKIRSKVLLEASGGINLQTVSKIAKTGIDRISVGQLTHSAKSIDFSLEFVI